MNSETKIPEHQAVYERLRDMVLLGRLAPGQRITIMGLSEQLGVSMTPIREALRRLTAENALSSLSNRRIMVPDLSRKDIDDIYVLRLFVEPELARQSVKNMTDQEIDHLRRVDDEINVALEQGDVEAYLERNNRFHFRIYELAEAPVLFHTARSLWAQVGPALRIVSGRYGTANLPDKHTELLDAFQKRDAARAAVVMKEDLQQSLSLITAPVESAI